MSQNISIYFSDTGGGHRSAAEAVEAGLRQLLARSDGAADIRIVKDNVAEKCHPINRAFVETYNAILRYQQPLMKHYYDFLQALKPESGFNLWLTADYFENLLQRDKPSIIVSVHPHINHCLAHAIKRLDLSDKLKLMVVVTDPGRELWRAWACPDADLTVVPNNTVADRLCELGVKSERIEVMGMPVHPDFLKPPTVSRHTFLSHLGLAPDALTICLNAGWAGGGNMLRVYEALDNIGRPLQAIFLCGHNKGLYQSALAAAAASKVPTAVLPFHDCMSDLMAAVDAMVTKAGGLTTYQAVARRLPLLFDAITEPMPQERDAIDMLSAHQLAQTLHQPADIIEIMESFTPESDRAHQALPEALEFNLTDDAIFRIADQILELSGQPVTFPAVEEQEAPSCDSLLRFTRNRAAGET